MNSKSPNNLSSQKLRIKMRSNKLNELQLKKKIQSSTSQTSEETPFILERRIKTKESIPLSLFNKKYKNNQDKNYFISKTRRIAKYNPYNLITKKELIIDTRSELFNSYYSNRLKRKKNSEKEIRNKKDKLFKVGYKIKTDKSIQINPNNNNLYKQNLNLSGNSNNINEENNNNNYNKTNVGSPEPLNINNQILVPIPQPQITNSLYTILAMRKNQFMDAYNDAKEKERDSLPKVKQLQFLMDKTPMANFFSRKKDIRTFISPTNSPLPYISLLTDDYSISEKIRFQKIMDKLTKLKKCIEDNPKKEFDIAKEFLLSIGLYDIENFYIEKLKNFIDFIKDNFLINPSKNIKENMLDILNGTTIHRPPISDVMDDINNRKQIENDEKLFLESQKMKKIYSSNNLQNNKDIVKNLKVNTNKVIIINQNKNDNTNNLSDKKNEEKETKKIFPKKIKIKKSHRVESVERLMTKKYQEVERNNSYTNLNEKEKEIILNYKGLPINLKRQKEIFKSNNEIKLDLVGKPQYIINILEKKFKDEEKANHDMRAKTYACWSKDLREGKNPKLYGEKRNNNDYEELKKRNMLTEYICLMKAKNNYEISKLMEKYKI